MFRRALASGVTIACGSDAGVFAHGANAREIELMVQYGMSHVDAIRGATAVAAQVLGLGGQTGQLKEGMTADVIAVRQDPIKEIEALRSPTLVIKSGVIVRPGD
jgi:imidazolonepropionase-like amidohydrolase